jgi:DNA-binding NarL/FixJ family response regulator
MSALGETKMLFVLTRFPRFVVMEGAARDAAVIRIILADSQTVYRVGLVEILSSEIDMRVVAQATTLEGVHRAVERFFSQSPTQGASPGAIILLDGNMISGTVDAISELDRRAPQAKIIAQLDENDESSVVELYRRGMRGIIRRSVSPDLLVKCIRKIAAGETWIDNQSVNRLMEAFRSQPQPHLSPKESVIVTYVTQGKRNKEIAYQLGTTEQVIKNYLNKVYGKLGISDRIELANYGLRHQLHKKVLNSGSLQPHSVPVAEIQRRLNGVSKA